MRRLLTLTLFLFTGYSGFSQSVLIKGLVIDSETSIPVIAASVLVDSNGVITNANGEFQFHVSPGKHRFEIEYEGYLKYKKVIAVPDSGTFQVKLMLESNSVNLGPVVITGSQNEKRIEEEIVSIEILPAELLKNNNAVELGEAVDKSIGVQVQDGQVSIRGGSSWSYGVGSRTAVLVDNISLTAGDLQNAELRFVPMEIVDQVEVVKGASSVIYGSSALNGVINVLTVWPKEKPKTEITIFQGVYDTPNKYIIPWWNPNQILNSSGVSGYHSQKYGNIDVVAGMNLFHKQSYLENNDENRLRLEMKTRYNHPTKKGMKYGLNTMIMAEKSGRFFLMRGDTAWDPTDPTDSDSSIYYLYHYGDGSNDQYIRTTIDPHFSYLTENGTRHRFLARYLNIFRKGDHDTRNASSNSLSLDYLFQKNLSEKISLTAGIPVYTTYSSSNLYPGTRISASGATYAQLEYKVKKLTLVGGMRYEFTKVFDPIRMPDSITVDSCGATSSGLPVFRFGGNYSLGKATFLRASWGQAYRVPSVGERCLDSEASILQVIPNGDLKPEKSWGLEIGLKQGIQISKFRGFFDFAIFWNEYKNLIEYQPRLITLFPIVLGFKPFNIQDARVAGFETSIAGEGTIGQVKVRVLAGYTYNFPADLSRHPEQRNIGTYLGSFFTGITNRFTDSPMPADLFNDTTSAPILYRRTRHVAKTDIEFFYRRVSIGGAFVYSSFPEMLDGIFFIAVQGLDEYIEFHEKGDFVFQARAGWQISERMKGNFIVKNLFNRIYSARPGIIDPPRNFSLQLRYTF